MYGSPVLRRSVGAQRVHPRGGREAGVAHPQRLPHAALQQARQGLARGALGGRPQHHEADVGVEHVLARLQRQGAGEQVLADRAGGASWLKLAAPARAPAVCVSSWRMVTLALSPAANSGTQRETRSSSRILPSSTSSITAVVVATALVSEARSYSVRRASTNSAPSVHPTRPMPARCTCCPRTPTASAAPGNEPSSICRLMAASAVRMRSWSKTTGASAADGGRASLGPAASLQAAAYSPVATAIPTSGIIHPCLSRSPVRTPSSLVSRIGCILRDDDRASPVPVSV